MSICICLILPHSCHYSFLLISLITIISPVVPCPSKNLYTCRINRTVSVECCYQNTGIAITSCLTIFSGEDQRNALGVPFFYTGMQTLIVGLFCLLSWKIGWTKAPANENVFKMIYGNYQDTHENEHEGETINTIINENLEEEAKSTNNGKSGVVN